MTDAEVLKRCIELLDGKTASHLRRVFLNARAFRRVVLLVLQGAADSDPKDFVTRVKLLAHEVACEEGTV